MIHTYGRALLGPLITFASVFWIHAINHYVIALPSPLVLPLFTVVFAAAIGGMGPGLLSAVISLGAAPTSMSFTGFPLQLNASDLIQLITLGITAPLSAIIVGLLR